ncbi:MAG: arylformamidase [Planctomycetes bacterium]|nr:arylformamidase [Planctomycetota bacterium]
MRIWDISQTLREDTVVWPGDTPFSRRWVMRLDEGMSCNVSTITMSVHCATHADAPYHFEADGRKADEMALEAYLGPCRVIAIASEDCVRPSDLAGLPLNGGERLLFKTRRPCTATSWRDDFAYMSVEAAEILARAGVRLVGLDTPSMDPMTSKTMAAHHVLCRAGIALLENLDLAAVAPGEYELIALPLKIGGSDSAPLRAILREMR